MLSPSAERIAAAINAAMPPDVLPPPLVEDMSSFFEDIAASVARRITHLMDIERLGEKGIEFELAVCAEDKEYWMNWYGWTYDPRNPLDTPPLPATLPFDLCERQRELWEWFDFLLTTRQDGCVKKSRGVGFTWSAGSYAWHKWRFTPGFKTTIGSRKATEVDQIGNPDSIFEKIRMLYRRFPKWMLPVGFNPFLHDKQMLLINPENGNTIRGEGGEEAGRGGRSSLYIVDEAAYLEHADRVDAATSANSDVRVWGSTLNPRNDYNFFQRKYNSTPPERIFRFHYSQLPINTPARMAKKKQDTSPDIWATDYEIDDSYTVEDICIPGAWVKSATKLCALLEERYNRLVAEGNLSEALPFKLRPAIEGKAGGDVGGGKAMSVIIARFGPVICRPKAWGDPDTTDTALKMLDYCAETRLAPRDDNYVPRIRYLRYDSVAIGQGVASTMKRNPRPGLVVTGVNTGNPASNVKWADGEYAHEKFQNTKAEGWWTARERFKKTHEMVLWLTDPNQPGARQHPVDELAALPDDPKDVHLQKLIAQLSQVKWFRRETGKIIMESKEALAKRGIPSPDYGDAYILTETGMGKAEKLAAFAHVRV
jgi:phage terminase large subunit